MTYARVARRELEREDQALDFETNAATQEVKDMSLKQGEKIKINIGGLVCNAFDLCYAFSVMLIIYANMHACMEYCSVTIDDLTCIMILLLQKGAATRDKKPASSGGGFLAPPVERAPGTAAPAPAPAPASAGHAFDPFGNSSAAPSKPTGATADPFGDSFGSR
jgi:hypothetical protein